MCYTSLAMWGMWIGGILIGAGLTAGYFKEKRDAKTRKL